MTVVVKLGSSVVATDTGELRTDVLDSVCEQVSALQRAGERIVMVTSGAITRGAWLKGLSARPKAMDELQAASALGQGDLFRAYEERLTRHGTQAAQILLTRSDITRRTHYRNARQTIERLINWDVVPVINENDTTATDEITFGDNDFLAAQVAVFLHARLLVLLTNTDGLYGQDPRVDPDAELIRTIQDPSQLAAIGIGERPSHLGRGGMGSKVAAAEMASQSNVAVVICNGTVPGTLQTAVKDESIGTLFLPAPRRKGRQSVFKLWLKYANQPAGAVLVDRGAADKLRESGSSLLAVGVVGSEGRFEAGDVVDVRLAGSGELIGKGMVEFSAQDLDEVKGLKSGEVRDRFPGRAHEVIHRDRFVLV
ncbi:MAG TPA: glutamate 5-kinase [Solirubrobacterales bacterium]|jgi:glutamate 5-kinase|nr:glutamate 5-kinase [Solirubrobacterales bacterium]